MRPAFGLCANLLCDFENASQICAVLQRPLAGPLNHRPVGHGIAERHAQLDDISARANRRQRDLARRLEIRDRRM